VSAGIIHGLAVITEPADRRHLVVSLQQVGAGNFGTAIGKGCKYPCASEPRARTTRFGIRSWSKWKIFSRGWKSSSNAGPRGSVRGYGGGDLAGFHPFAPQDLCISDLRRVYLQPISSRGSLKG
jgi:hypothetical protein